MLQSNIFIIRNISSENKKLRIFDYPLLPGNEIDLMKLEISECEIRNKLFKGALFRKLLCNDITLVKSTINLLKLNASQIQFLKEHSIDNGASIVTDQGGGSTYPTFFIKQGMKLIGEQNSKNRVFTTAEKFINGEYYNNIFHILIRHNGRELVEKTDFFVYESEGAGTGFDTIIFTFSPKLRSSISVDYTVQGS